MLQNMVVKGDHFIGRGRPGKSAPSASASLNKSLARWFVRKRNVQRVSCGRYVGRVNE